jgi:hypothetical protein
VSNSLSPQQIKTVRDYSAGLIGTRKAIEELGMRDYADLIIALARNDLDFPKPTATPTHEAQVALARSLLQPRLRHAD